MLFDHTVPAIATFKLQHAFLSNFYPSPIELFGVRFATIEHAYQAMKTADPIWVTRIAAAATPGIAKIRGQKAPMRENWKAVKIPAMWECIDLKFNGLEFQKSFLKQEKQNW